MINTGDLFTGLFNTDAVYVNEPMKKHTSFKIGGLADVLFLPSNVNDITSAISICRENNIPFYIVGNGTNLLVTDKGYKGVIIKISKNMSNITTINDDVIYAESGILLSSLANYFSKESLEGFEFASGIPGTLGGALCMNAGAYGKEMKDVVLSVDVLDETGNIVTLSNDEMNFGYRSSKAKEKCLIILGATFKLISGNKEEIKEKMFMLNKQRSEKQPLSMPSAGSTFKRPEGFFAGKLIMDSGLKGHSIGDAQVSEKHCGFIVNKGNATAEDVIKLIEHIKQTVERNYKIELEQEVVIIGEK